MTDHDQIREWLRSLDKGERKVVKSVVAAWDNQKRKTRAGGRPVRMRICSKCGGEFSTRQLARKCPDHTLA